MPAVGAPMFGTPGMMPPSGSCSSKLGWWFVHLYLNDVSLWKKWYAKHGWWGNSVSKKTILNPSDSSKRSSPGGHQWRPGLWHHILTSGKALLWYVSRKIKEKLAMKAGWFIFHILVRWLDCTNSIQILQPMLPKLLFSQVSDYGVFLSIDRRCQSENPTFGELLNWTTLQGTNISFCQSTFEDEYSFSKVEYRIFQSEETLMHRNFPPKKNCWDSYNPSWPKNPPRFASRGRASYGTSLATGA